MKRRTFLMGAGGSTAAWAADRRRPWRVALIGHTGRGNYGHDWDIAWNRISAVRVTAIADPVEAGRKVAQERSGAAKAYDDFRDMIASERPEIVTIGPRWTDQRVEMVAAAARAGAHVLLEKPFAGSLPDADAMVKALNAGKVKLQLGHVARPSPVVKQARQMLDAGEIGDLLEVRARGKEDRRAGGEDMVVLGSHCFDLMRLFLGDPQWVFAQVRVDGRPAEPKDIRQATEPVGWIAGNQIDAVFGFPGGVNGHFASRKSAHPGASRFGVWLLGSRGALFIGLNARRGEAWISRSTNWTRSQDGRGWEPVGGEWPEKQGEWNIANYAMATDLLEAIEGKRQPVCSAVDGRWTVEMMAGVYQSHFAGKPMGFPLQDRADALATLRTVPAKSAT